MDLAMNYERCLALNPRVGDAIRGAVRACSRAPVKSVILWGSIPLGGYVAHHSDVDLLVVTSVVPEEGPWAGFMTELAAPGLSALLIPEGELGRRDPVALRGLSPRKECALHAMDLILLKRYSLVVHGADVRGALPDLREADEIAGTIRHVREVMVPEELRKLSMGGGSASLSVTDVMNVANVMVRCLYTLRCGAMASKPAALEWAAGEFGKDPARGPFTALCRCLEGILRNDPESRKNLPGLFREAVPVWEGIVDETAGGNKP